MRTEIKEGFWVAELGRRVRLEASPILLSRQCVIHNISQPCRPPRTVPCIGLLLLWYGDLWGGRDTDPYFHDVDLSSRWMVSFSLRLLHPWENKSHCPLNISGRDASVPVWKIWENEICWPYRNSKFDASVFNPVAVPTALFGLFTYSSIYA
jgi:hypothetical protein